MFEYKFWSIFQSLKSHNSVANFAMKYYKRLHILDSHDHGFTYVSYVEAENDTSGHHLAVFSVDHA